MPVKKNAIAVADKNPFAGAIGHRVRVLRAHLSLSQIRLARLLNVTQDAISRLERGVVAGITYQVLEGFLKVCDENPQISPSWLIFGHGPMELSNAEPGTRNAEPDGAVFNPHSALDTPHSPTGGSPQ